MLPKYSYSVQLVPASKDYAKTADLYINVLAEDAMTAMTEARRVMAALGMEVAQWTVLSVETHHARSMDV